MSEAHRANPAVYAIVQRAFARAFRLATRLETTGLEHLPATGAYILASNHLTYLDGPLIFAFTPREVHALAASKYRRHPFGWLLRLLGAVFVDRERLDRGALRRCLGLLADGRILAVAIEGTRSRSGVLTEGKHGVAWMASQARVPVVPVVVYGVEQVAPALRRLRRARISLRYGAPIRVSPAPLDSAELHAWTESITGALAEMLPPAYRPAPCPSPQSTAPAPS